MSLALEKWAIKVLFKQLQTQLQNQRNNRINGHTKIVLKKENMQQRNLQ